MHLFGDPEERERKRDLKADVRAAEEATDAIQRLYEHRRNSLVQLDSLMRDLPPERQQHFRDKHSSLVVRAREEFERHANYVRKGSNREWNLNYGWDIYLSGMSDIGGNVLWERRKLGIPEGRDGKRNPWAYKSKMS